MKLKQTKIKKIKIFDQGVRDYFMSTTAIKTQKKINKLLEDI